VIGECGRATADGDESTARTALPAIVPWLLRIRRIGEDGQPGVGESGCEDAERRTNELLDGRSWAGGVGWRHTRNGLTDVGVTEAEVFERTLQELDSGIARLRGFRASLATLDHAFDVLTAEAFFGVETIVTPATDSQIFDIVSPAEGARDHVIQLEAHAARAAVAVLVGEGALFAVAGEDLTPNLLRDTPRRRLSGRRLAGRRLAGLQLARRAWPSRLAETLLLDLREERIEREIEDGLEIAIRDTMPEEITHPLKVDALETNSGNVPPAASSQLDVVSTSRSTSDSPQTRDES
jgi:hypothetical protein